jgi:hypothetical protein
MVRHHDKKLTQTGMLVEQAVEAAHKHLGSAAIYWSIRPKELIKEMNAKYVFCSQSSSSDNNGNHGWLKGRECPKCWYAGGFIWSYPACHIKVDDRKPLQVMLDRGPTDSDKVICECCGFEGTLSEWQLSEDKLEYPKKYWKEGDQVACFRRRKGTQRNRINDLYRFFAKRGTDKVVRWCIDRSEICKDVMSHEIAKHICRYLKIQFVSESLTHRQHVLTRATVAESSVTSI